MRLFYNKLKDKHCIGFYERPHGALHLMLVKKCHHIYLQYILAYLFNKAIDSYPFGLTNSWLLNLAQWHLLVKGKFPSK